MPPQKEKSKYKKSNFEIAQEEMKQLEEANRRNNECNCEAKPPCPH